MILVTGCTGYIGSRLCKRLLGSGFQVRGLVRPAEEENAKDLINCGLIPHYGDLNDLSSLHRISDDVHFIYHLAGTHSTYNHTYNLYVQGTANLIQTIPSGQTIPIVVASNSSVYSNAKGKHSEGIGLKPNNLFGAITLKMEKVVKKFCDQYAILRIGEVYGDLEANPFVNTQRKTTILGDGSNNTSKIYVDDLINILVTCLNAFPAGVFNVCDDEPVSQMEFYHYAEQLSQTKLAHFEQTIELSERVMLSIHGLRTLDIAMTNKRIKGQLNYQFLYPTYKDGLKYLHEKNVYEWSDHHDEKNHVTA